MEGALKVSGILFSPEIRNKQGSGGSLHDSLLGQNEGDCVTPGTDGLNPKAYTKVDSWGRKGVEGWSLRQREIRAVLPVHLLNSSRGKNCMD